MQDRQMMMMRKEAPLLLVLTLAVLGFRRDWPLKISC